MKESRDLVYTTIKGTKWGDRDLHVDVFRPDNDSVYPALLMIHGGGWNSGSKALQVPMAQEIAKRGYVTIPVEYRLIPEALYPAGLHDVKTAIRWVRKNSKKLGVDPDKIAVSGCSAGAQLATLAGVTNGSAAHEGNGEWLDTPSTVNAIINMDGVVTFVSDHNIAESHQRLLDNGTVSIGAKWLGGDYPEAKSNWEEASPLLHINANSAPICFINSNLPRYCDGSELLGEKYAELGIHNEHHKVNSPIHPFWFFDPWFSRTVDYATDFLDHIFGKNR